MLILVPQAELKMQILRGGTGLSDILSKRLTEGYISISHQRWQTKRTDSSNGTFVIQQPSSSMMGRDRTSANKLSGAKKFSEFAHQY